MVSNQDLDCGLAHLFGLALHGSGAIAGDIWVHLSTGGWGGEWSRSQCANFGAIITWQGGDGSWSSDGTQLAIAPVGDGIWVVDLDGSGLHQIAQQGTQPS